MGKMINTLNGARPISGYKKICMHEHLLIDMTHEAVKPEDEEGMKLFNGSVEMNNLGVLRRNPYVVRENLQMNDVKDTIEELRYLEPAGVDLLFDLTTVGLGRDMKLLKEINDSTFLDIVAGTGLFVHDSVPLVYQKWNAKQIAEWMIHEIKEGIEDSGIKAGVIGEIGVSERIYPLERESLIGAALTNLATGLPIFLHTYPWTRAGLEAVKLLLEQGVLAKQICVCHVDVSFDYEYLKLLLDKGVYLEFDNFGKEFYFQNQNGAFAGGPFETDRERVKMLKRLIQEGHGDKILIANDLCLKTMQRKYGGWGYDHIFTNIAPMMLQEGIEAESIQRLMTTNPFTFIC